MSNDRLISEALEAEVTEELRQRGIVVWLDKDEFYNNFVDDLVRRHQANEYPFPVIGFRGSFLSMMLDLEPLSSGLNNAPLLIHMPGFNEETIRQTPILEYYKPGFRFRKALDTLIRETAVGRVKPDELERYVARPKLALQEADAWLAGQISAEREGLAGLLERTGISVVVSELLGENHFLAGEVNSPAELNVLHAYLNRQTGMTEAWGDFFSGGSGATGYDELKSIFAGWLLCVEYVHDLARPPHLDELKPLLELSKPLVKVCLQLVKGFRGKFPEQYMALADEVEQRLQDELPHVRPEDLGKIDTFRVEEARILQAAIDALKVEAWEKAHAWAEKRAVRKDSIWLEKDQTRRWTWSLVKEAASLGICIKTHPRLLDGVDSLEGAVEAYRQSGCEVDRAHRRFEQKKSALLLQHIPHFGDLLEVVVSLRRLHRAWADDLAKGFTAICKRKGFLPDQDYQQRTIYEQVVHPLTQGIEKVAFFHVDGFRYEMATELVQEFADTGTVVDLRGRLAELPSVTSVGMNVLPPVASGGKLLPVVNASNSKITGFRAGEFTVSGPQDRARAMGNRSVGKPALIISLSEACEMQRSTLQKKAVQTKLIMVHSREIDNAGEASLGPATFEHTLQNIRTAWNQLKSVGVKTFVFSADHGFLFQDETSQVVPYGKKNNPNRRYVLAAEQRAEPGMVNISLSALGYDGVQGYLLFLEDTSEFDTGDRRATFVHGGNSLQERLIPVLTVKQEREAAVDATKCLLEAETAPDVLGLRCLKVRARFDSQIAMGFLSEQTIELDLRAPQRQGVRAIIRDVRGAGVRKNGRFEVRIGDEWSEVFFNLQGPLDDRTKIEVFHPGDSQRAEPLQVDGWFVVEGTSVHAAATEEREAAGGDWQVAIEDDGIRKVFEHLDKHGSITEQEAGIFLGSPRQFRRFSARFEEYLNLVPFRVRIEGTSTGKRYVKER
ncbi:MAG: BREX-6 system phosphatase PglZ [Deltaproteobacteria bacterium]|nr:BREX-6 system phosphatase PglZ [Deltaproteobacteria bacterium]MCB9488916.1 BREX-6 system phosphatase PglZ [Deltaproteobacteria bacterium]